MISFLAFNPIVKQLRTDKGFRVELDVSQDQYDVIKELPKLQDVILKIDIDVNGGNE